MAGYGPSLMRVRVCCCLFGFSTRSLVHPGWLSYFPWGLAWLLLNPDVRVAEIEFCLSGILGQCIFYFVRNTCLLWHSTSTWAVPWTVLSRVLTVEHHRARIHLVAVLHFWGVVELFSDRLHATWMFWHLFLVWLPCHLGFWLWRPCQSCWPLTPPGGSGNIFVGLSSACQASQGLWLGPSHWVHSTVQYTCLRKYGKPFEGLSSSAPQLNSTC